MIAQWNNSACGRVRVTGGKAERLPVGLVMASSMVVIGCAALDRCIANRAICFKI